MRSSKMLLSCNLVAAAATLGMQAAVAAAGPNAHAGQARWDRRDFNGIWFLAMDDPANVSKANTPQPKPGTPQYWGFDTSPELKGSYLQYYRRRRQADLKAGRDFTPTCKRMGLPLLPVGEYADEILQTAKQINWYQEFPGETWRIYLDGRPHRNPAEYPATLTGDSTGKWEGDTLVVDTINIRTDTLLYGQGRSASHMGHGAKMHIVQRIRLIDKNHLQMQGTVEDPEALVRPWHYTLTFDRGPPGSEVIEYLCEDNNREHVDSKTGQEVTEIPPRHNPPPPPPK
jgi:hypothetical protein